MAKGGFLGKGSRQQLALAILLVIVAVIAFSAFPQVQQSANPPAQAVVQEDKCPPAIETFSGKDSYGEPAVALSEAQLDAPSRLDFPFRVFASLPAYPADLEEVRSKFKSNQLQLNNIKPDYWKQPEFYPYFEEKGVPLMKFYPTDAHAAFGYGTYPSEYIVTTAAGANFDIYFLVRADWGVVNYQGLRLVPIYPSKVRALKNSFSDGSTEVQQDPGYVRCRLQVSELTPSELLIGPAYPAFSGNWAKRVKLSLKVGNLKPGKYAVGLDVVTPDAPFNDEMTRQFGGNYVTGGGFGTGQPWLTLYIDVK